MFVPKAANTGYEPKVYFSEYLMNVRYFDDAVAHSFMGNGRFITAKASP